MAKLHVSLTVASIARSVDFYRTLFAAEPVKQKADYAKFDLADPPVNFTLSEGEGLPGGTLNHLGIQLTDTAQVLAASERLQAAGVLTEDEMQTTCCYALQDKVWVEDPDGHRWEFFHVIDGDVDPGANGQSACCAPVPAVPVAAGEICCR